MDFDPGFLARQVVGVQFAREFPEMLAGVIEIDDLQGAGKVLIGQVPDPFGAVADDDLLLPRGSSRGFPGFQIDAFAKVFGGLNGSGMEVVESGSRMA